MDAKKFAVSILILAIMSVVQIPQANADEDLENAVYDNYTYPLPIPDKRLDGKNFLSGPEHWVGTNAPVEPQLPDTRPVTAMHSRKIASDGKVSEHWESCDDACGPGCGESKELMGGCKVVNSVQNPALYTWTKPEGGTVTCGYETWQCKTHNKCIKHDRCLLNCKINKGNDFLCKLGCHLQAAGFCATIGGWIIGDPIPGCWQEKLEYSRVIPGSCREG